MAKANSKQGFFFTTEPKTRRHVKKAASGKKAKAFMFSLFKKGLRELSYDTLKFEFINFFETNDPRVIEKYIGRPEETVFSSGSSLVRVNRTSGKIAEFQYMNRRRLATKKGLMEVLGYLTMNKKTGRVTLHHERFSYSTWQSTLLESMNPKPRNPFTRIFDEVVGECSKDDLCVLPIELKRVSGNMLWERGLIEEKKKKKL